MACGPNWSRYCTRYCTNRTYSQMRIFLLFGVRDEALENVRKMHPQAILHPQMAKIAAGGKRPPAWYGLGLRRRLRRAQVIFASARRRNRGPDLR